MHGLVPCIAFNALVVGRLNGSEGWSGSSVGLEQQPSKLWVKGSNPFRITKIFMFTKRKLVFRFGNIKRFVRLPVAGLGILEQNPFRITSKKETPLNFQILWRFAGFNFAKAGIAGSRKSHSVYLLQKVYRKLNRIKKKRICQKFVRLQVRRP